MTKHFEPFTPETFKKETGFDAADNEAIYFRWVNSQINYANYKVMSEVSASLKQITQLLGETSPMKELKL